MTLQTISPAAITMATYEIAELTGKRHFNVLRDARKMVAELYPVDAIKSDAVNFESSYVDVKGETRPCLRLPKREVWVLITGYSVPLRAAVVDRLAELEAALERPQALILPAAPPDDLFPLTPLENFASTALAQFKKFGTSLRDVMWHFRKAITDQVAESDQNSLKRDQYLARQVLEGRRDTQAAHEDIRRIDASTTEIFRYLTREPDWVTLSTLLREKNVDAGGLLPRLSKEAEAWFTARSKRLQIASPKSNLRATQFERQHLERWWKEDGRRLYQGFLDKRKPAGLVLIAGVTRNEAI